MPDDPARVVIGGIPLIQVIKELEREQAFRANVYARMIDKQRLTQADADIQNRRLTAALTLCHTTLEMGLITRARISNATAPGSHFPVIEITTREGRYIYRLWGPGDLDGAWDAERQILSYHHSDPAFERDQLAKERGHG